MSTSSMIRRTAAGLCAGVLVMAALAGCERRPTEVPAPTPAPDMPPITAPTTPSTGSSMPMPMTPSASAASQ